MPSAQPQATTLHRHGKTLAEARNAALEQVKTEHIIFLDADDELEEGYVEQMATGSCDLRGPAVRYVRRGMPRQAAVPRVAGHQHECEADCLVHGNYLCIGTCARVDVLRRAGGFREFEWSEDWDLWLRCYLAGASIESIPSAVYRAHVRQDSRNRAPSRETREFWHRAIYDANFPAEAA